MIKIIADGDRRAEFSELLRIISECAALPLELHGDTISRDNPGAEPRSATLRASMIHMVDDEAATVTVQIVTNSTFGLYGQPQRLNAAFALDVANGVQAAGIAIAIHEMWENYTAQRGSGDWKKRFGAAHSAALGVESQVMSELTGLAGLDRVASIKAKAKGSPADILDYLQRYVVITPVQNRYSAALRDRRPLESLNLADGTLTDQAEAIGAAVKTLGANPQATAGITGRLANQVRNEITVKLKEDFYLDEDHPELGLEKEDDKGAGADLGDLRSFADRSPVTDDARHGRIIISAPA